MIKKIYYKLRYSFFFPIIEKIFSFLLSLKNKIFYPNKIIGIYDLKYRDLSYDIFEFLSFLKIKKKLLNKNKIHVYIYSVNKFKKNSQFQSFFLEILKSVDIDFELIDKNFFTKYNNFKFNTFFFNDTADNINFFQWDKLSINQFENLKITKTNLYYENLIKKWLIKNNIDKNKLVTITIRNNPNHPQLNTKKNFILNLYYFLIEKNYQPLFINDNLNPLELENPNILQIKSNDFLYRVQFYKEAILNISNSRGAGNIIITLPTNWLIYNFQENGRKRYEFFKKINEIKGKFCHIDNLDNLENIKKILLKFFDLSKKIN